MATRDSFVLGVLARLLRLAPRMPGRIRLMRACSRLLGGASASVRVGGLTLRLEPADLYQAYMMLEGYDTATMALYKRILRPGDVYVDVGAQVGYFAGLAAARIGPAGCMLLLEPDPRAYARLRAAIDGAAPGRLPAIRLLPIACSDRGAERSFYLSSVLGQSSLAQATTPRPAGALTIETRALDDLIAEGGLNRVRLLKMDIEGHEPWALRGLARTLGDARIDYAIVEKNVVYLAEMGHTAASLHAFFRANGYVGAHEDGRPISRQSLGASALENLVYARSEADLRAAAPASGSATLRDEFSSVEIERFAAEIAQAEHPEVLARRLIPVARSGNLNAAIADGARLLERHPDFTAFRGDFAHWLVSAGRIAEARDQYAILVRECPDDATLHRLLSECSTGADRSEPASF